MDKSDRRGYYNIQQLAVSIRKTNAPQHYVQKLIGACDAPVSGHVAFARQLSGIHLVAAAPPRLLADIKSTSGSAYKPSRRRSSAEPHTGAARRGRIARTQEKPMVFVYRATTGYHQKEIGARVFNTPRRPASSICDDGQ